MLWYGMTNEWKYMELYAMVWDSNGIRFQCYGIRLQCYAMLCYSASNVKDMLEWL